MSLDEELAASDEQLKQDGHTTECVKFWHDVLVMDAIGERWDHWTQPSCPVCAARRRRKGLQP